jgi:hypothetical protein
MLLLPSVSPDKLVCLLCRPAHFGELSLHDVSLLSGIVGRDNDSDNAHTRRKPQTERLSEFKPKFSSLQTKGELLYTAVKGICAPPDFR